MSYLMTVEISNSERNKVLEEFVAELSYTETIKHLLKTAGPLHVLAVNEKEEFIKAMTKALGLNVVNKSKKSVSVRDMDEESL